MAEWKPEDNLFVISRNLGPEVGVAVGILFYLGTTIATSVLHLRAVEMLFEGFSVVSNTIDIKRILGTGPSRH